MALSELQAGQVINTYIKFCNEFQVTGEITDKNFNRIRVINSRIGKKKDDIISIWGNLFDEVYELLEKPEIKSRLEDEKKEREKIKINKIAEKKAKSSTSKQKTKKTSRLDLTKKQKTKNKNKKQKINNKKQITKNNNISEEKSIGEIRKIFWISVAQAKQNEQVRKELQKNRAIIEPIKTPICRFDDSSMFEDIMDERRAEGKGYGGAK